MALEQYRVRYVNNSNERICPAVPAHDGSGFVTACCEAVADAETTCPKCGRPVWFMGSARGRSAFVQQHTQLRKLYMSIRQVEKVLNGQQDSI